jgi:hypothetical protein
MTGNGDIVTIDPFAQPRQPRLGGVFFVAITVVRLVTLELAYRRR